MDVIGIAGKKRSGKDTFAKVLARYGYERYAFADNIKQACKVIFGFTDEQLWGDKKEEIDEYWGITPRYALQLMGTDAFRQQFGEEVWIRSLKKDLIYDEPEKVIIPDVRFPNEVEHIQQWGGIVVRIDADKRLDNSDTHASETALDDFDDFDYVIPNNGTITEFAERIDDFTKGVVEQR